MPEELGAREAGVDGTGADSPGTRHGVEPPAAQMPGALGEQGRNSAMEKNTQNGITWEFREEGGVVEVDLSVGSTLVQVENCKTQGAAEISVKSFLANHRAVGKRMLKLLVGPKSYRVKITDVDTREQLYTTQECLSEARAWEHATDWIDDNPEPAPGELMPEVHEPAANDPAVPAGPVTCPACGCDDVKLRQGSLSRHKASEKPLLTPNAKGHCAGGGLSLAEVAKKIEAEGDRKVVDLSEPLPGAPITQPDPSVSIKPPTTTPIPDNLPEIAAIFAEIEDRRQALKEATAEFNEAKAEQKAAQGALDDANSRLFQAWKNGGRQVSLPLGDAEGPAPAKLGDVTDQAWSFNGRDWTIKLKKLGVDQYLAMIPELAGDTDGHGQTVEAAVEESKGKAAILLFDTDPGEMPAKRSKKKSSKKTGPKKAAKRSANKRAARGKATVTEGRDA